MAILGFLKYFRGFHTGVLLNPQYFDFLSQSMLCSTHLVKVDRQESHFLICNCLVFVSFISDCLTIYIHCPFESQIHLWYVCFCFCFRSQTSYGCFGFLNISLNPQCLSWNPWQSLDFCNIFEDFIFVYFFDYLAGVFFLFVLLSSSFGMFMFSIPAQKCIVTFWVCAIILQIRIL